MIEKFKTLFFVKCSLISLYLALTIPIPFISIGKSKFLSIFIFVLGLYLIINITSDYVETSNEKISSSKIRELLKNGEIEKANHYLHEKFSVSGLVIQGDKRGRTIGIPTANLQFPEILVKIPYGVYSVQIKVLDKNYYGIANFGMRPTFNKISTILEVHIFDFDKDIYDKEIEVIFFNKIRDEQKFSGIKELLNQITLDITVAKKFLNYGN